MHQQFDAECSGVLTGIAMHEDPGDAICLADGHKGAGLSKPFPDRVPSSQQMHVTQIIT